MIIKVEDRFKYYEFLEMGNVGDIRFFIRFIVDCIELVFDYFLLIVFGFSVLFK